MTGVQTCALPISKFFKGWAFFILLKLIDWANLCNFAIGDFVIGLIILVLLFLSGFNCNFIELNF